MAILASANLVLVLFDLSYVPLRSFYLQRLPILVPLPFVDNLTQWYDPVKGIEPHRDTQAYLETVEALRDQVDATGLRSPKTEQLLQDLRDRSAEIIETDPFQSANKSGTLEKIKNRMRKHMGDASSTDAFSQFWSQSHLSEAGWRNEISFFETQIEPLIATNYYRPIGEAGDPVDYFWVLELPFLLIFGLDFLGRTFYISRRHAGLSWLDAMLWRWYDIFLLLPFWRWLRIIPVLIRLDQARLINLEHIRAQVNQGFAATFAEELTEVVVVRVINQIQGSIKRGEAVRWLTRPSTPRPYIDINNVNEVEAIGGLIVNLLVYQVLPKVRPDLEAIINHSITSMLSQSPLYQGLQSLPGLSTLPTQITEKLVTDLTQATYDGLVASLKDPVGAQLSSRLVQHFTEVLSTEVQNQHTLETIQALLTDLLEEVKLNYIQRLSEEDVEDVLEQTRQLRQIAKS